MSRSRSTRRWRPRKTSISPLPWRRSPGGSGSGEGTVPAAAGGTVVDGEPVSSPSAAAPLSDSTPGSASVAEAARKPHRRRGRRGGRRNRAGRERGESGDDNGGPPSSDN